MLHMLIRRCQSSNLASERKGQSHTPDRAHDCAFKLLEVALNNGACLDSKDHASICPLHDAVIEKFDAAVILLLERKADPNPIAL